MELSISNYEADLLKQALGKNVMMAGILGKIDKAEQHQKEMASCEHKFSKYVGEKVCCAKCMAMKEGEAESWTTTSGQ